MNKRDLKEDLRLCKQLEDRWEEVGNRPWLTEELCIDFAHEAREGWPHAIERALKAEALARKLLDVLGRVIPSHLVGRLERDLDSVLEAEKERADKLESLVRDVERVLERMKFLSEEGLMIDEIDDYQLDVAIAKAKEVLGGGLN